MGKEILTFDNIEIEKKKFYRNMALIFLKDGDLEKVLISNKIYSREKTVNIPSVYFYNGNKVKPLKIMLPETRAYIQTKCFD